MHAEHEADQRGEHRKHHGVADRAHHLLGDRAPGGDRGAEIAVDGVPHPDAELHRQRPVEAVGLAHLLGERLRGVGRQHRDERIARRDVHQQKAHQRHREHDRHDQHKALGDVEEHSVFFSRHPGRAKREPGPIFPQTLDKRLGHCAVPDRAFGASGMTVNVLLSLSSSSRSRRTSSSAARSS